MEFHWKNILSFCGLLLLLWLCARFLLPFFLPFLLGTGLALASEPAVCFLTRRGRLPGLWPPGSASAPPLPERWPLSCSFWGCCCGSSVRRKAGCPGLPKPLAAEWACSKNGC